MSSIKTTQIDGDVSVGRNVAMGGKATVAGSVTVGHNLKVSGWLEAPNVKGINKGIYHTLAALQAAYPTPSDGWLAGVGTSSPFTAYIGDNGVWTTTGGKIAITIDLTDYVTKEDIEDLENEVEEIGPGLVAQGTEAVVFTTGNTYIRTTGEIYPNSSHTNELSFAGFIPLQNVVKLIVNINSMGLVAFAWYSGNTVDTFIGYESGEFNGVDIIPRKPSGANYVCLCSFNTNNTPPYTPSATIYYEGRVVALERVMGEVQSAIKAQEISSSNLPLTEQGFYDPSGNIVTSTSSPTYHTALTPIAGWHWLRYFTNISSGGCGVAFFDSSKNFIASLAIVGDSNNTAQGVIDLTDEKYANASYVSISFYDIEHVKFAYYRAELRNSFGGLFQRPLDVLILGDSITDYASITVSGSGSTPIGDGGKTTAYRNCCNEFSYTDGEGNLVVCNRWPFLLCNAFPVRDMRNYALSGASYKTSSRGSSALERQNLHAQLTLAIADYESPNSGVFPCADYEPDVVIFALGTNDGVPNDTPQEAMAVTGASASAIINALDETKFCQSARKAFLLARMKWPMSLIFCELPVQRADREQLTEGCNEYLREMANRCGIIIIDAGSESGIVREFEKTNENGLLLKDGLHPNKAGQELLARCIISSVRNNYENIR